jgi:hypothetical protein
MQLAQMVVAHIAAALMQLVAQITGEQIQVATQVGWLIQIVLL